MDEVHYSGESREKGPAFFKFMIQCSHISRASGTKAPLGALQTALLFACEVIITLLPQNVSANIENPCDVYEIVKIKKNVSRKGFYRQV